MSTVTLSLLGSFLLEVNDQLVPVTLLGPARSLGWQAKVT
jgi:hypothetical protein